MTPFNLSILRTYSSSLALSLAITPVVLAEAERSSRPPNLLFVFRTPLATVLSLP